jgi:hypothetical protein
LKEIIKKNNKNPMLNDKIIKKNQKKKKNSRQSSLGSASTFKKEGNYLDHHLVRSFLTLPLFFQSEFISWSL